ncbi:uncharacterized protein LOC125592497 [Brassica napus]|uniref:uncharacterized protein LOC125592497 n=1 Tax=Brassica napus TaxID=3708 RepID=UPI002079EE1C|nr:uncharacterized protein LOC125592497 [Brassica napus]
MAEKMMAENNIDENMIDLDNDDLLGETPDLVDAEKIEAISQLSPANAVSTKAASTNKQMKRAKTATYIQEEALASGSGVYVPKGLLKKKAPRSPDIKGARASKKLQGLGGRASPKKKTTLGKRPSSFSSKVPRIEVFPSASRKKYVSLSGSVVSQKPPKYRENVWERLTRMSLTRSGPWLMLGDFNEITSNLEKKGGRKRPDSSFLPFKCMLDNCGMIEFPYKGNSLSWVGNRASGKVQCRLDRAVGNEDWHHCFSNTNVEYLRLWGSDHRPILTRFLSRKKLGMRNFKFDKRWIGKNGFRDTIEDIKDLLEQAQTEDDFSHEVILRLKWSLCEAFRDEELYWKQKSRATWLREGDQNTKFFHATTKQRRARNRVTKLRKASGLWAETEEEIEAEATGYFQTLFTTSSPSDFAESLKYITEKVTPAMNEALTKPPSNDEIRQAAFDINPEKAPGPDGMTGLFFQRYWGITAEVMQQTVKDFFQFNVLDPRLNQTNICLIPKTERPVEMTNFRPISLCNVSYKIISNILSKRLKRCLPRLISETQSAFVARRLITDNILVAHEVFHALRTNPSCKAKFVAIKTDMSKAFDRVEWSFLEARLLKLGFSPKWVAWIKVCISSVSYQVLLNGEPKGHISPSRGIRQGDPLSPFLFILLTEALISQIQGAEREGRITGLKIARNSPPVSHLLFADDSLFFCRAEVAQCTELMQIINTYGCSSGQQLNVEKSSILFGNKVPPDLKKEIKQALEITKEGGMGVYLGLLEKICGSKKQAFAFIQERLQNRINSWSAKLLSKGGKEVLLKSVAQALPTYVMSCFLLPQDIIRKLTSAISRFWWSTKDNNRGLRWIAWAKICTPKDQGGLGFRDFKNFNLALLAKQLWRLIQYPNSLLARVLKGRYFRNSNPMDVTKASTPSYVWRSLMAAQPLLKAGLRKTIGTGQTTLVWVDPWIPTSPARPAIPCGSSFNPSLRVSDLCDVTTKEWNDELLQELIAPNDIPLIRSLKLMSSSRNIGYCWNLTATGVYSVKTGYALAMELSEPPNSQQVHEPSIKALQAKVWKIKTSKNIQHFIWQSISSYLPVSNSLVERHCGTDRHCPRCGSEEETPNHLLFECPPSIQTWALADIPHSPGIFPCSSIYSNLNHVIWRTNIYAISDSISAKIPWLLWYIWKARNDKAFNGKDVSPLETVQLAQAEAESCNRVLTPLHAEFQTLLWAMKSSIQLDHCTMNFKTDCLQLVKLLEEDEEDNWPSMLAEFDEFHLIRSMFTFFSISFIPRSLNFRADRLAKEARSRGFSFSHVNSQLPSWMASEAILSEA